MSSPLQHYGIRVLQRWPVIVALALVGAFASAAWAVTTATTSYTATTALSTQSSERGPEQDAVLALGYVDYFNQDSYQELLRRDVSIPADVTLSAMTGATSPILYISATGPDEQAVSTAAAAATEAFRNDVRDSLVEERRRAASDLQTEIDRNAAELVGPEVLQDVQVNIVLDQIRSLQGRLTDIEADNTNHLKVLQPVPGVASSPPSPLLDVALGAAGGGLLGVLAALLLVVTDSRVRTRVDVRPRLGVDALADLTDRSRRRSRPARPERARRVGNLANSLRLAGPAHRTVVAVVAPRHGGVSGALARELAAAGTWRRDRAVLVRGELFADPDEVAETLAGVAESCTLVVLDVPPLLDALASQLTCAAADRVLLVLDHGVTRWSDAREAVALLAQVQAPLAGVVIDEQRENGRAEPQAAVTVPRFEADGAWPVPGPNGDHGSEPKTSQQTSPHP